MVDGCFEGGAHELVVVDGHGPGAVDPENLDDRVWLSRGRHEPVWPCGLDASFDAIAFVGQHVKAGTPYSFLTHTQSFNYVDLSINGISIGEYGQVALCTMELNVPAILACGEEALAAEAQALTPGVVTAAVKRGVLPDGLDHLDGEAYGRAKLGAIHCSPPRARTLIRKAALDATKKLKEAPNSFHYPKLGPPYVRIARFRKDGDIPAHTARDEHSDSITALMNMPFTRIDS